MCLCNSTVSWLVKKQCEGVVFGKLNRLEQKGVMKQGARKSPVSVNLNPLNPLVLASDKQSCARIVTQN